MIRIISLIIKVTWVTWITMIALYACDHMIQPTNAVWGAEKQVVIASHKVQQGDTLGEIAKKYGTTWQKLHELNPWIKDPNWIYVGDEIAISVYQQPLTPEEKRDKLAKFMFKKAVLPYDIRGKLEWQMGNALMILYNHPLEEMDSKRKASLEYVTLTRKLEIWQYAEAIVEQTQNDTEFYRLTGLAWQESHFVNKRGKLGERSCFQFLPSTLKYFYQLDDIGLEVKLYEVENYPYMAVRTALEMLRSYKWNWSMWNNGLDYEYHLNNKIHIVKKEFIKR